MPEREPSLTDIVCDWLVEQNVQFTRWLTSNDSETAVRGFGWAIIIEDTNISFTNRLENEIIKDSVANPTILDTIKAKISDIESKTMDYIIEHVDDDGWEDWARKTDQPPPLGPQYSGNL